MNESVGTPRTDELRNELDPGWPLMGFGEAYDIMTEHARTLERELAASLAAQETMLKRIVEHNDSCLDRCGRGEQEAVRCGYRPYLLGSGRRCPECPTYEMIDLPAAIEGSKHD